MAQVDSQPSFCPYPIPGWRGGLTFRGGDRWPLTPKECRLTLLRNCLPALVAWGPPEMGPLQGSPRKSRPHSQIPFSFPENLLSLSHPAPRPLTLCVTHHAHICWWPPLWDTNLLASVMLGLPGPPTLETTLSPTPQALDTSHMPWSVSPKQQTPLSSCLPKVPTADSGAHSRGPPHVPPGQGPRRLIPGSRSLPAKRGRGPAAAGTGPPWLSPSLPALLLRQMPSPLPPTMNPLCAGNWSLLFPGAGTGSNFPV